MTENEAIERIKEHMEIHKLNELRAIYITEAFDMAITALKEIQLYKDGKLCLVPKDVYSKQCCELDAYKEIGTVEECREGVEKQWPKKPEASDGDFDYYKCPACGACIWGTDCVQDHNYCLNCGQAIDWEESGEE